MITSLWTIGYVFFGLSCLSLLAADGCDLWRTARIYERWSAVLIVTACTFIGIAMCLTETPLAQLQ